MGNTCKSMADSCQCMTKTTLVIKFEYIFRVLGFRNIIFSNFDHGYILYLQKEL